MVKNDGKYLEGVRRRILELAQSRGFSLYDLSEKSGVSHSALYAMKRWNSGPSLTTLYKLCVALEVSMDFLGGTKTYGDYGELQPFSAILGLGASQRELIKDLIDITCTRNLTKAPLELSVKKRG